MQDDLGSPMELLNAEGGIRESYAFDEFGEPLVERSGFIQCPYDEDNVVPNVLQQQHERLQPFGFTGYQKDVAGGLYFAQARRYDASAGRFISEDKIKGFADAPFTLNAYSYCWNKPTELVDLNGLAPTAGVTAAMGEELNGQTHPTGPTAGVTSDIGDVLSAGEYRGNTLSYDNESENVPSLWESYQMGTMAQADTNALIMNTIQNMDCVIAIGVGGNIGAGAGTGFEGLAST